MDCYAYALDINNGDIVWKFETSAPLFSSPVCIRTRKGCDDTVESRECVVFGGNDSYLYCLHAASGDLVWKFKTSSSVYGSVGVMECKSPVVPSSLVNLSYGKRCSHDIHTTDSDSKKQRLLRVDENTDVRNAMCTMEDNSVDLTSQSTVDRVVELKPKHPCTDVGGDDEVVVVVVVVSTYGEMYVVDATDGSPLTTYKLPGEVYSSPVLVGSTVVVGCRDDYIYQFKIS